MPQGFGSSSLAQFLFLFLVRPSRLSCLLRCPLYLSEVKLFFLLLGENCFQWYLLLCNSYHSFQLCRTFVCFSPLFHLPLHCVLYLKYTPSALGERMNSIENKTKNQQFLKSQFSVNSHFYQLFI